MPARSLKPCQAPGCGALVDRAGLCPTCTAKRRKVDQERRGNSAARGYDHRWRKARLAFLRDHPLCECDECKAGALRTAQATVVDHIIDHNGDPTLFWDRSNWRAMAKACHDRKTAKTAGYGRKSFASSTLQKLHCAGQQREGGDDNDPHRPNS